MNADYQLYTTQGEVARRAFFPSLVRVELVSLACSPPIDAGRPLARWTQRELADYLAEKEVVPSIHQTTVGRILNEVELQPHRTDYWLTSRDPNFREKATEVLDLYERAWDLEANGRLVVCLDEKPNLQALSRPDPDLPPRPGKVRKRDFHYNRHGTVNILLVLDVASGKIWVQELRRRTSDCFIEALEDMLDHFDGVHRLEAIMDNASSHCSKKTMSWFNEHDRIQPHFTPARASWLNQAELALGAFSSRYLKGKQFFCRDHLRDHIPVAVEDYNTRHAFPFDWSFTKQDLSNWLSSENCHRICASAH